MFPVVVRRYALTCDGDSATGYVDGKQVALLNKKFARSVSTRILGRRTAPFHLFLFLTASRMVLPQDPSADPNCALLGRSLV